MSQEIIEGYRLSPQQRHLWTTPLLSDRSAVCAVQINGELDVASLRRAIQQVIAQHEILRTTFKLLPGMTIPVQVISNSPEFAFASHNVQDLGVEDQEAAISARFNHAVDRKIDHARLPVVHIDLIARSSSKHVLIISLPVLCADTQSLECLVSQIAAAYTLPSPSEESFNVEVMQYVDFAEWKNELLESETGSSGRRHWRQEDLSQLAAQKLSFEKRVGAEKTFPLAAEPVEISAAAGDRIRKIADRSGTPVRSFALVCWQILISRLTGQSNIVVGVAFDGRKFAELENMIGLCSTSVPIQSELTLDLPFRKLLQQTTQQELEAQRWQEYFAWDDVGSDNLTSRFLPFCFEFHKAAIPYRTGGLEFSVYKKHACTDHFKIKFTFEDREDRFSTSLQYDASLFSIDDVRRLADQLTTLIEDASNRPEAALGDLELMSEVERHRVLVEFNDTKRPYSKSQSVHQLFEDQVAQRPEDVSVVCEAEWLSYRDLNARANQLARYLLKLGVGPDVAVGLCLERSVDLIVGLLGILKAGGAYVPLDPGLPNPRLSMILEDSGARVLVTRTELTEGLRDQLDNVVCLDSDAQVIANESSDNLFTVVSDENLVYLIFTSGSTGRPKGVAVEHRQLVNYINGIWEALDLPAGSSFATVSTIAADLGNTALFTALCKGGPLHLITEERATDPDQFAEYFSRNQIDCLKIVPSHLSALLSASYPAGVLPLRRLVLGGEACPWSLVEKIGSLSPDCVVLNHYGPTEATVGAVINRLRDENIERISDTVPIGRPIANVQAYVLDWQMRPAPIGAHGELYIGGAGLARGYINCADVTAERFIPSLFKYGERLYRTGDLARYLADGRIEFLGRGDDQLKIHGYRIEPGEIEIALRTFAGVQNCVVVAREDNPGDKRLVAYVVTRDREQANASELRVFLKDRLPDYMTPSAFVFIDRLPLTPNGKIDRSALPAPDHSRFDGDSAFASPRNQVEETLVRIWSHVLGVERVGVHDNFFDLGGDSILSIQIIARAHQAGLSLSPRQLFQHQTVSELAKVAGVAVTIAEQESVTGHVPLTPVQLRFFEIGQAHLHHYNQAMLLEVHGPADPSLFAKVTRELLHQHDVLRLRFALNKEHWKQTIAAPDDFVPFEMIDLSSLAEAEQPLALAHHAAGLHASLNLQDGPVMRVALFDRGQQRNLLIVIHHLAMDGVSWRILLEDLQALYQQLSGGEKPKLPPKTTSFKTWAERLTEYARSGALDDELSYWLALGENSPARLPLDHVIGANTVASARTVFVSLNADETRALLQEVPVVYRTQVNEVLLTAFVRALVPWTGSQSLLVDLEGHGREEILDGVNLSRTIGWFTTIFPVMLDCGDSQTAVETLRSVKEQLRRIPNRGIGYGLLRYASGDSAVAEKLQALPQAEVRFNYLGQVDRVFPDSAVFSVAPQPAGPAQHPEANRAYLLNIIGRVTGGELRLEWTFSENLHRWETVARLANSYLEELRALITQSRTTGTVNYLPSDFPHTTLSQEELNKVLTKLRG